MEPDRGSLEQNYASRPDDELIGLHKAGTLTALAYEVIESEMARRGLEIPARPRAESVAGAQTEREVEARLSPAEAASFGVAVGSACASFAVAAQVASTPAGILGLYITAMAVGGVLGHVFGKSSEAGVDVYLEALRRELGALSDEDLTERHRSPELGVLAFDAIVEEAAGRGLTLPVRKRPARATRGDTSQKGPPNLRLGLAVAGGLLLWAFVWTGLIEDQLAVWIDTGKWDMALVYGLMAASGGLCALHAMHGPVLSGLFPRRR